VLFVRSGAGSHTCWGERFGRSLAQQASHRVRQIGGGVESVDLGGLDEGVGDGRRGTAVGAAGEEPILAVMRSFA